MKILNKPFSAVSILKEPEYEVEWLCPKMESREWLYDRINKRVDLMIEQGIVDETKYLLKKHGRIKNFVETMLSFADKALYESKKKRNCVTLVPFESN